ncbi:hypothetical protein PFISCL1PPCAC_3037 [Pristionchus fissidentatus]|uniref:F-box domain-containing protein n=1 Tax=Pristionchus fissidentatus TaxID=1538716 RepID=A0AAV5UZS7_9BILA|nr:hypothetical protein PFISCL1PPCAC_3037 [Pristionchus fissidentatus]
MESLDRLSSLTITDITFMDLSAFPPEIFNRILRHVEIRDRLTLREVSKSLDEAVSRTDLYITHEDKMHGVRARVAWDTDHSGLSLFLGKAGIECSKIYSDGKAVENDPHRLLRLRRRLFKSLHIHTLHLDNIYYTDSTVAELAQLIDGFVFERLSMNNDNTTATRSLGMLPMFEGKILHVTIDDEAEELSKEVVASLPVMTELCISEQAATNIDDALCLHLFQQGHERLGMELTPAVTNPATILAAILAVRDSPTWRAISFTVPEDFAQLFILYIGVGKGSGQREYEFSIDQSKSDIQSPNQVTLMHRNVLVDFIFMAGFGQAMIGIYPRGVYTMDKPWIAFYTMREMMNGGLN